ncbi:MAG: HEAT repeat domain-containing protein [Candidatus Methanoperedens sp.]|nr:HEAT repeat domain-containing protein [Candidatus Methanoperedens sp.]
MVPPSNERNLQNFQDYGKTGNLLEFVRASGLNVQKYRDALDALGSIFESLSFGEQPIYRNLDLNALQERKTEVKDIVNWMADSNKADMKTVAIELMGFLGWESFVSRLERCLLSEFKWERLTAIKALEQMGSERAVEILRVAIEDSDPEIREAVRKALKRKK